MELASTEEEGAVNDFIRIYVLFVCNCLLFSEANYSIPSFLFSCVDDLEMLNEYAWGKAIYDYLVECIAKYKKSENLIHIVDIIFFSC